MKMFLCSMALAALAAFAVVDRGKSNQQVHTNNTYLENLGEHNSAAFGLPAEHDITIAYQKPINGLGAPATINENPAKGVRLHDLFTLETRAYIDRERLKNKPILVNNNRNESWRLGGRRAAAVIYKNTALDHYADDS